jgi:hypothetical protein
MKPIMCGAGRTKRAGPKKPPWDWGMERRKEGAFTLPGAIPRHDSRRESATVPA